MRWVRGGGSAGRGTARENRFLDGGRRGGRLPAAERRRRRRELILIGAVLVAVALLTIVENRMVHFGTAFPVSNTILMFTLINLNLLLLILLIFLVFRNLVKLLYERRRKVMGSKLRTRLVVAFIAITLLPTAVLFFFSINFITSSIEFWFNVPVEAALGSSLRVGRRLYDYVEDNNRFFLERVAYQIQTRGLLAPDRSEDLDHYISVVQRAFNIDAVEVYGLIGDPKGVHRLGVAVADGLANPPMPPLSGENLYAGIEAGEVRSIAEHVDGGELVRTIGTVPFGVRLMDAHGLCVLSVRIPPDLSESLSHISRGVEEYQQIKLLKDPIQLTYYITISIVALLVVFCAIWFGFYLAKSISIPIRDLAEGTRRVAEGDLGFSIARAGDDEIGSLVDSFNRMTRDLRSSREQLELSAQMLRDQNVEIEERRRYMEIVLKNVSTGVITLDAEGNVATANTSAERMLQIRAEDILDRSYRELLGGQHLNLAREVMDQLAASHDHSVEFPLKLTVNGSPRSFRVHVNALLDDAGRRMGLVMVFDDLTDLEKAQRMAAWREVARRIAHEVKNPLTPIKLSAQRLHRKYAVRLDEPVFEECTRMIIDHVDLIRNLVNEFSAFARFPAADPRPCDPAAIVTETVALYREGHPEIAFEVRLPETELPRMRLDRRQIKQALINLVTNAINAVGERGTVILAVSPEPPGNRSGVRLIVADDGPGIDDETKARLFEPYFSTHKTGMGLGLTIVSSIVEEHGGRIAVRDNTPRGAAFVIDLPL